jgi:hypothetical protein
VSKPVTPWELATVVSNLVPAAKRTD